MSKINMDEFCLGDTTELDKAIANIVGECMDAVIEDMDVEFTHEWAGIGNNGRGHPIPKHPLMLQIHLQDDLLTEFDIREELLDSLSGLDYQNYYHQSFNDISTALRKLADDIDEMNNISLGKITNA